ncbi:MAG: T9SS type A sorting domain-containing protein [Bacteroidales bacterium]|nr:T9SS type A sorting domain-containing protein [Bacteroidales bacterium]
MKKIIISLVIGIMATLSLQTNAQTNPIPNNGFENWSTGQAYSVMNMITLFNAYNYPTSWDYLKYPVNESISLYGMPITINTNIPLVKASAETGTVPDGQKALKIESFMLSDIITQTAYPLVSSYLDSSLTNMVFPTLLSTGETDLNQVILLLSTLIENINSDSMLMAALVDLDINEYITGGIALNGFNPVQLKGIYKYQSGIGGDQGGIIYFGTKYNPTTHHREVVGGGGNINLTDVATYQPFAIDYTPMHDLIPDQPLTAPDSLVVILLSSASLTAQQGSALFLDNLILVNAVPEDPDTCFDVQNITITEITDHSVTLHWDDVSNLYECEYGPAGFVIGTGTTLNLPANTATLTGLTPNTDYGFHIRSVCGDNIFGNWSSTTFHTSQVGINNYREETVTVYPNPAREELHVRTGSDAIREIRVYSIDGRLVEMLVPNTEDITLRLPYRGIFILQVETENAVETHRIVRQ